ncbi:MAG: tetratricopeptide repeat protein [Planctomycetota bacterium]
MRLFCLICLSGLIASCGSYDRPARDVAVAEELHQKAVSLLDEDPERAEELLQRALEYDLYHGSAHNNLGVLLLNKGLLYQAAQEFEWARKLLPGHPEPRTNLAIALHRGGRTGDALESCQSALEVRPFYIGALQARAMINLLNGNEYPDLDEDLLAIRSRGENSHWRRWAHGQLLKREGPQAPE